MGVDVKARFDVEGEVQRRLLSGLDGNCLHRFSGDFCRNIALLGAQRAAAQGQKESKNDERMVFHFAEAVLVVPLPRDFLIASSISDSLSNPSAWSTTLPERSR